MAKIIHETEKFYPTYPVFILMAKIAGEVVATTYSSSYTIRDTLVAGMDKGGRTAQALKIGQKVSLNFLNKEQGLISDLCGTVSGRQRLSMLQKLGLTIDEMDQVPMLVEAHLTIVGEVRRIVDEGKYSADEPTIQHVFIRIEKRLIDETLLDSTGKIDWRKFEALEYAGDGSLRVYKPSNRPDNDYWMEYRKNKNNHL